MNKKIQTILLIFLSYNISLICSHKQDTSMSCLDKSRRIVVTAVCYPVEKLWLNLTKSQFCTAGPQFSCGRCKSCKHNSHHNQMLSDRYSNYLQNRY